MPTPARRCVGHPNAAERENLMPGGFLERDVLDHRVRVSNTLQNGRLFYAGDAAHLITPAGGKGMNMAIQDAIELASGLCERYGKGTDPTRPISLKQRAQPVDMSALV